MSFWTPDLWLSAARFAPFLNAADGDYERALDLYDWHAELSASSHQVIHRFEVVIRNAIDRALGQGQPQEPLKETWLLDFDLLRPSAIKQVIVAAERLERGKALTRGRVIAGLPFGFWAGLFGNQYEELWRQHLRDAFPYGSPTRKDLAPSMGRIRRLRNRVARHDCLLSQDVGGVVEEMVRIVSWVDPEARAWLVSRTRVFDLLERPPLGARPQACPAAGARAAMPSL